MEIVSDSDRQTETDIADYFNFTGAADMCQVDFLKKI